MKIFAAMPIILCLGLWAISHSQVPTFGLESPLGAFGVIIQRGSILFGTDDHKFAVVKPFFEVFSYLDHIGSPPTFFETLKGRFGIGADPQLPWVCGASIPIWAVTMVAVLIAFASCAIHWRTPAA